MKLICSDLEGVFIPEIWINVAEKTGIEELRLTTRDIKDYNVLMKKRLSLLKKNNLKITDITNIIEKMEPLPCAFDFLLWLKSKAPVIIVSDTFYEFAGPLMEKLGFPALFCHNLKIENNGSISDYKLRQKDAKRKTVIALKQLEYEIIAFGDSYNDISMLKEADRGFLFNPPLNVITDFPEFKVTYNYKDLKEVIKQALL